MRQHLPERGAEIGGADELPLGRQQQRHHREADHRAAGQRQEAAAPADIIGQHAGDETAEKSADRRRRGVDAEHAVGLVRRKFVADIGDGDREDRRQQQPVNEAPEDDLVERRRQRRHGRGDEQQRHRHDDQALSPDHVGQRAGERRGRGHRQGAGGDDQAGVGGADAVLARHHRQHRLRRVQVQERADGAEGDGDAARIGEHGRHSAQFC